MVIKRKAIRCIPGNNGVFFILIQKFDPAEHGEALIDAVYALQYAYVLHNVTVSLCLIFNNVSLLEVLFIHIVHGGAFTASGVCLNPGVNCGGNKGIDFISVIIDACYSKTALLGFLILSEIFRRDLIKFLCDNG